MFVNIFCVLVLFRLHFLSLDFVCVYFGLPPFPYHLHVFYKIFFALFFKVIFFYFWFLFVCTLVYLPLLLTYVFFKILCFVFESYVFYLCFLFVCVYFGLIIILFTQYF